MNREKAREDRFAGIVKNESKEALMKTKILKVTVFTLAIVLWAALMAVESYELFNQLVF